MKKLTPYLLICCLFFSCKKKEVLVIEDAPTSIAQIKIDQVINDSTIVLKWSKYTSKGFKRYVVKRQASYWKNGQFNEYYEPIDSSTDINKLSFTESKMPYSRRLVYYIFAENKDESQSGSGSVFYDRANSPFYGFPKDVLINTTHKLLYFTEGNKLSAYDYNTGRQIAIDSFANIIGFCGLGDFNGSLELYVPVNDGWVQILDAATLQRKDKIYVAGEKIGSVVADNGKVYVSSTDEVNRYPNYLKIYDRAAKTMIGVTGTASEARLVLLDGPAVEMIEIPDSDATTFTYYYFNPDGTLVSKQQYMAGPTNYRFSYNPVRSFPDGSKFINNYNGAIFTKSLTFDKYVKPNAVYNDFAFNADGSVIYAAAQKQIDAIAYPSSSVIKTYPTSFHPYKIFRDGNTLICASRYTLSQAITYVLIEKINL